MKTVRPNALQSHALVGRVVELGSLAAWPPSGKNLPKQICEYQKSPKKNLHPAGGAGTVLRTRTVFLSADLLAGLDLLGWHDEAHDLGS